MKRVNLVILFLGFIFWICTVLPVIAQKNDTTKTKVKKGWTFGALPVVAYDTDVGLQYGALVNLFDYGDGTMYPNYRHSLYLEWSNTTKGSMIARFYYDSEYLIPNIRFTADISYLTEKALNIRIIIIISILGSRGIGSISAPA